MKRHVSGENGQVNRPREVIKLTSGPSGKLGTARDDSPLNSLADKVLFGVFLGATVSAGLAAVQYPGPWPLHS